MSLTLFLCFMTALFTIGAVLTLRTTPLAPRKPEPSSTGLMWILLMQAGLAVWSAILLYGRFA